MSNEPTLPTEAYAIHSETPNNTPISASYQIREKLATLEDMLLNKLPGMPVQLREIHTILKKDPEQVTLLSEQECAILVRGLKKQTGVEIATVAAKKPRKKPLSQLTLADL